MKDARSGAISRQLTIAGADQILEAEGHDCDGEQQAAWLDNFIHRKRAFAGATFYEVILSSPLSED